MSTVKIIIIVFFGLYTVFAYSWLYRQSVRLYDSIGNDAYREEFLFKIFCYTIFFSVCGFWVSIIHNEFFLLLLMLATLGLIIYSIHEAKKKLVYRADIEYYKVCKIFQSNEKEKINEILREYKNIYKKYKVPRHSLPLEAQMLLYSVANVAYENNVKLPEQEIPLDFNQK